MASRPGVVWGSSRAPSDLAAQLSVLKEGLEGDGIADILEEFLQDGADQMERTISTEGVHKGQRTSEGRVKSGAMLGSVSWEVGRTRGGRTTGKFGYLNNPPKWTIWQEYGTQGGQGNGIGIKPMMALTAAYTQFETRIEDEFEGRVLRFMQGQFK